MKRALRLAFMGTPDFAVPALRSLIDGPHEVVCVYSQPPRPKGRGRAVQLSPVQETAEEAGIPVRTPKTLRKQKDIMEFMGMDLDVAVVAAYGLILPKEILDAPEYGCLNIHASLLPRWRGAAPIQRAILAGDTETGITIMQMDEGIDTGPMIASRSVQIRSQTTAQGLHDELSALGAAMIGDILDRLAEDGGLSPEPQPSDGATYAQMLRKEDGRIDWAAPAEYICRQIRALTPWPGTWCLSADGKRLKILDADFEQDNQTTEKAPGTLLDGKSGVMIACGAGTLLRLLSLQPENKKPMNAEAAMNGGYFKAGDILR